SRSTASSSAQRTSPATSRSTSPGTAATPARSATQPAPLDPGPVATRACSTGVIRRRLAASPSPGGSILRTSAPQHTAARPAPPDPGHQETPRGVALARRLDLEDFGSPIDQMAAGEGARQQARQVQHSQAHERAGELK